jgi:hypothetical protein
MLIAAQTQGLPDPAKARTEETFWKNPGSPAAEGQQIDREGSDNAIDKTT